MFRKEFLVENNKRNKLTLDALMNNRIIFALQVNEMTAVYTTSGNTHFVYV